MVAVVRSGEEARGAVEKGDVARLLIGQRFGPKKGEEGTIVARSFLPSFHKIWRQSEGRASFYGRVYGTWQRESSTRDRVD